MIVLRVSPLLLILFFPHAVHAQPNLPTEEDLDEAMETLTDYSAIRTKLTKFAVAARVERVESYRNAPEKDRTGIDWYLSCWN